MWLYSGYLRDVVLSRVFKGCGYVMAFKGCGYAMGISGCGYAMRI